MDDSKTIWVIAGRDGYSIGDETFELLTEANILCKNENCLISVFLFGVNLNQSISDLEQCGLIDSLYAFESQHLQSYNPYVYLSILKAMYQEQRPFLILLAGTSMGRDLAPRLAHYLDGGFISNIQQIKFTANKELEAVKPIYGDKVHGSFQFSGSPPWIATLIPGVVGVEKRRGPRKTEVFRKDNVDEFVQKQPAHYNVIDFVKADPKTMDISEADIIVAGGRGINGQEGIKLLTDFADLVGGTIGCTRPLVDKNIFPLERQIGQTGKIVRPKLFFSWGISGAIQHEMGMKDSKHVIAINLDSRAQVFRIADLKVIADAGELLPKLIHRIKEHKLQKGAKG